MAKLTGNEILDKVVQQ